MKLLLQQMQNTGIQVPWNMWYIWIVIYRALWCFFFFLWRNYCVKQPNLCPNDILSIHLDSVFTLCCFWSHTTSSIINKPFGKNSIVIICFFSVCQFFFSFLMLLLIHISALCSFWQVSQVTETDFHCTLCTTSLIHLCYSLIMLLADISGTFSTCLATLGGIWKTISTESRFRWAQNATVWQHFLSFVA